MIYRQDRQRQEEILLCEVATKSSESAGRKIFEEECPFRTCFQRDRDRIIHSKAFRRLMHKTQVFISPEKDHFRTRLTHTLEVTQVARSIARMLALNEDLTEAIALGHDLGHTPFGHTGEAVLNEIYTGGFHHNEQSLRVVDLIETRNGRRGMNLTYEIRDGIVNHTGGRHASTPEGQVVKISDRIAYINHDIDDAMRSGAILKDQLPSEPIRVFGKAHSERISNMIEVVVENSDGKHSVGMDEYHNNLLMQLRSFMFENVYGSPMVKKEEDIARVDLVIKSLYNYFLSNPDQLPDDMLDLAEEEQNNRINDGQQSEMAFVPFDGDVSPIATAAKDYIAGMTDRFALNLYGDLFC